MQKGEDGSAPSSKKLIPIPVQHETSKTPIPISHESSTPSTSGALDSDLLKQLTNQEVTFEAEKESMRVKYEGTIKLIEEQLSDSQNENATVKKDYEKQKELLANSRKAVNEIRSRYEQGLNSWNEEKKLLEKQLKAVSTCLLCLKVEQINTILLGITG